MWALSRRTADPPGQPITGCRAGTVDQMGVAALGNAGGGQRDGGVEGGKRRKNWQKEEMGGSAWEGWLEGSTGKFRGLVLP